MGVRRIRRQPFELTEPQIRKQIGNCVELVVGALRSYYIDMPRGDSVTEYAEFEVAYNTLARATDGFTRVSEKTLASAVSQDSLVFVVIRCVLGFSPPELADLASKQHSVLIAEGRVRVLDKKARARQPLFVESDDKRGADVLAMLKTAARMMVEGAPAPSKSYLHRLEKIDTRAGLASLSSIAKTGAPYPALLYERFMGRPFASHRDAVSEHVGDIIESAVEKTLQDNGVPYYKTRRAQKIPDFDQAPDFLIPDERKPVSVIEAKLTEDPGTARDKITRVQHLRQLSDRGGKFEVIACIDGRGFSIRTQDMKKLLAATRGKVFTMSTMDHLVEFSKLKRFRGTAGKT